MKARAYGDKELIDLCLQGQEKGFAMLYERYSAPVFRTVLRLLNGQTAEAEDVLQEAFVAVFSGMERLKGVNSFEAWVKRVAINMSISHLRKRKVYFQEIGDLELMDVVDETEDLEWRESRLEEIEREISILGDPAKTIVQLFLFEDMSQEEIGKILGMSHTAVRSQYHRAKNRIAIAMKKEMGYEENR